MNLPKYLTEVTPLSKKLALALLIILPLVGFYLGIKYQQSLPSTVEYIEKENIVRVPASDSLQSLISRCGFIPDIANPNRSRGRFDAIHGPMWAPDCRHIAWSLWESGTSYLGDDPEIIKEIDNNPRELSGREGVFTYNDSTQSIEKIYNPSKLNETPSFIEWKDKDTLIFEAEYKKYEYYLPSGEIRQIEN